MKTMVKEDNEYKDIMCIYKIINNITGKVYVGSTINLKKRINSHIRQLNLHSHPNSELQNDWDKYKSNSFSFEIIEKAEDKILLPKIEKKYIDLYKNEKGVYNKSDPIEEFDHRKSNEKRYKLDSKKGSKRAITQKFILEYLDENYSELIEKMRHQINQRKYFYKDEVDNWIINDIKNDDVKNDDRLMLTLHRWYNKKLKFCVIKSNMYKREFKELFGLIIEPDKELLVNHQVNSQLYDKKIKKLRK